MFDPPISSGANIFVIIAVGLMAIGAAITVVDIYQSTVKKSKEHPDKK